jgi:hypothetical protein
MRLLALAVVVWILIAVALALVIGPAPRLRDHRESPPSSENDQQP